MNESRLTMKEDSFKRRDERLDLQAGQTARLHDGKGTRVHVLSGAIWLTQEGDVHDIAFGAGGWFTVQRDGLTVLQAVKTAQIHVDRNDPAPRRATWRSAFVRMLRYVTMSREPETARRRAYRL